MKDFILRILILIAVGELVAIFVLNKTKPSTNVLSEKTISTPVASIGSTGSTGSTPLSTSPLTPSPTARPTPTVSTGSTPLTTSPSARPTPKPTPTPIPEPKFTSEQINGFIERFAALYSVDPNLIRHIALCESGFDPFAKRLSYAGLFQFGPVTWKNMRIKMGEDPNTNLRYNAEEAVQTAAYALHINDAGIWPNCVHN